MVPLAHPNRVGSLYGFDPAARIDADLKITSGMAWFDVDADGLEACEEMHRETDRER